MKVSIGTTCIWARRSVTTPTCWYSRTTLRTIVIWCRVWTYFVPVLQANLNHTPVPSLDNRAPIELFCVLPAMSPLDFCLDSRQKQLVEIGEHPQKISENLERLRESAQAMHRAMTDAREKQTQRNKDNQGPAVRPNFDVGDFVLRSRVDQKYNDKLLVTWIGPYQLVRADEHSFRVRHLVTGIEQDVHPAQVLRRQGF
jgi:hypothetical protein